MPPRVTDRSITTCRSCRRRKIRCDRSRPKCNRCRENGASCVYEDQVPQPAPVYEFIEEMPGLSALSRSSTHSMDTTQQVLQQPMVTMSQERLQTIESRVETLSEMVRNLQSLSAPYSGKVSSTWTSTDAPSGSNVERQTTDTYVGYLSQQSAGRMHYVDQTFWASLSKEVADLDELLASHGGSARQLPGCGIVDDADWLLEGPSKQRARNVSQPCRRDPAQSNIEVIDYSIISDMTEQSSAYESKATLPNETRSAHIDFRRQLPPRAMADSLLEGYIQSYHPMVPLIHVPTFRKRYKDFWAQMEDVETTSISLAALVIAVLYAAAVACPDIIRTSSVPGLLTEDVVNDLHNLGMCAVRLTSFPKAPTLDSLTAYILLQTTSLRKEEPFTCLAFVGLALRVANMLGLHRDPSHFDSINAIEAETRRRIWWHIVHTDVHVAIASGLPPIIDIASWDVQAITELKEEFWDLQIGRDYEAAVQHAGRLKDNVDDSGNPAFRSMVSTSGILVAGKLQCSLVLRRALARLSANSSLSAQDVEAMRSDFRLLGEDLLARMACVHESYNNSAVYGNCDVATYENNPVLDCWSHLVLSVLIDQTYCLVCHPILKSPVGSIWTDLYPTAIEHCQSLLFKSAQLASSPDFRHFQWSWPGNHQPLHAITILLLDILSTHIPASSATCLASRRSLEITFALCAAESGLSAGVGGYVDRPLTEGGKEAWALLQRLRDRAWRHAGWDTDAFWTREQAVAFCNKRPKPPITVTSPDEESRWTEAIPNTDLAERSRIDGGMAVRHAEFGRDMMSPPNIDWAYLDAVLEGTRDPMELSFGFEDEFGSLL